MSVGTGVHGRNAKVLRWEGPGPTRILVAHLIVGIVCIALGQAGKAYSLERAAPRPLHLFTEISKLVAGWRRAAAGRSLVHARGLAYRWQRARRYFHGQGLRLPMRLSHAIGPMARCPPERSEISAEDRQSCHTLRVMRLHANRQVPSRSRTYGFRFLAFSNGPVSVNLNITYGKSIGKS